MDGFSQASPGDGRPVGQQAGVKTRRRRGKGDVRGQWQHWLARHWEHRRKYLHDRYLAKRRQQALQRLNAPTLA